jgi:Zn-dependent peptidase ImmA (M78 family)
MERTVNPRMVTLARDSRGWSQKELADAISVGQAKISKIEAGLAQVSEDDLHRLSRALCYTEELFCIKEEVYGLGSSFLFHRKRQNVPVGIQRRIEANVHIMRLQVERLLRGVDLEFDRSFDVLNPSEIDGQPERAAQLLRAAWRMPTGPVQDVTALIESAGGIVLKCDFDTPLIDAANFCLPGLPPLFFVNRDVPGDRLRWTLTHELAHTILHRHYIGEDIEDEADRFAGEFLMPKVEIKPHLHDLTLEKAAVLKSKWKVSMASLIRQAHRHKCITNWKYKSLNISLSTQGYKKVEPFPVAVEEPRLIRDVVAIHRTALGFDKFELARLLFTEDAQFFYPEDAPRLMGVGWKQFFVFASDGTNGRPLPT